MSLDEILQGSKVFSHCPLRVPLTHSLGALKPYLTGALWDHLRVLTPVSDNPSPPFLFPSAALSLCCDCIALAQPGPAQSPVSS